MLATVTNRAKGARGFATLDREVVLLEAGASALLDLADHLLHRAWAAEGQVLIAPLPEKEAKAARKLLAAEAELRLAAQTDALNALPPAVTNNALLLPTGEGARPEPRSMP